MASQPTSPTLAAPAPPAPSEAAEGPVERLLRSGARALSDVELLGVVLSAGRLDVPTLAAAQRLLHQLGGLDALVGADRAGLRVDGLDDRLRASLLASLELATRLARAAIPERACLKNRDKVARYLALRYGGESQEVMGVLFLDLHHGLVAERELFRGALGRAAVEPGAILREALRQRAVCIIVFHTHPGGSVLPTEEDMNFTDRMREACDQVGIPLVDHLIVAPGGRWQSVVALLRSIRSMRRTTRRGKAMRQTSIRGRPSRQLGLKASEAASTPASPSPRRRGGIRGTREPC
ncbi:MAG TPA: DNA repair protein RadC [Thermoanaerobaculia bacterium]|nr:DNA repair protein RadC [Thermoanaerobaculia bacterium]